MSLLVNSAPLHHPAFPYTPIPSRVIADLFQGLLQHREWVSQRHRFRVLGTHPHRRRGHLWSQGTWREHGGIRIGAEGSSWRRRRPESCLRDGLPSQQEGTEPATAPRCQAEKAQATVPLPPGLGDSHETQVLLLGATPCAPPARSLCVVRGPSSSSLGQAQGICPSASPSSC